MQTRRRCGFGSEVGIDDGITIARSTNVRRRCGIAEDERGAFVVWIDNFRVGVASEHERFILSEALHLRGDESDRVDKPGAPLRDVERHARPRQTQFFVHDRGSMRDVAIWILRDDAAQFDVGKGDVRPLREVTEGLDAKVACIFIGGFFCAGEDAQFFLQKVGPESKRLDHVGVWDAFGGDVRADGGDTGIEVIGRVWHGVTIWHQVRASKIHQAVKLLGRVMVRGLFDVLVEATQVSRESSRAEV